MGCDCVVVVHLSRWDWLRLNPYGQLPELLKREQLHKCLAETDLFFCEIVLPCRSHLHSYMTCEALEKLGVPHRFGMGLVLTCSNWFHMVSHGFTIMFTKVEVTRKCKASEGVVTRSARSFGTRRRASSRWPVGCGLASDAVATIPTSHHPWAPASTLGRSQQIETESETCNKSND